MLLFKFLEEKQVYPSICIDVWVKMASIAEMRKALFDEGLLDKQFEEIEALQTPDDCTFVEDIFNMFLNEMGSLFSKLKNELGQDAPNAQVLEKILHRMKGCTASVGAKQLSIIGNEMREHALKGEILNCRDAFVRLENQLVILDQRMPAYFEFCKEPVTEGAENPSTVPDSAAEDEAKGKEI